MTEPSTTARVAFEVDRDIYNRWGALNIPWGMRAAIMRELYKLFIEAVEEYGLGVISFLLAEQLKLKMKEGAIRVETRRSPEGPREHVDRGDTRTIEDDKSRPSGVEEGAADDQ